MNKVAVVILNWNGAVMLREFLPLVLQHSAGEGVEVCVADNASTDASREVVRTEFPTVRLIELAENYGFAEGYNRALAQVEAEYVVLLNSDVEVTPHWLDPLVSYMDAHPDTAACQPKIRSQRNKAYFEYAGAAGGFLDRYGYPFCRGRIFDTVEKDEGQYNKVSSVLWATGAAFFIRLKDYRESGGLDGRFFAHMEEIDLCWRLRTRGRNIVCIPQSTVFHVGAATLKKESPRKTFLNFRNNLLMLYKNLPEQDLKHVLFVRCILDYVAALVFLLKGQGEAACAVYQARREFQKMKASYREVRRVNMQKASHPHPNGIASFSILWKYHFGGKKRYSQLENVC